VNDDELIARHPLWAPFFARHGSIEEDTMGITTHAPQNPYRRELSAETGELFGSELRQSPRRHDTEHGPGLSGSDLDRIARQHHFDGYAKAEREYEAKLDEMRAQLAQVFDEGYMAGRVERAQGLAQDVFSRLFEPELKIIEAQGRIAKTPKADAREAADEALEEIRAALVEVREFAAAMFTPHDPDAAAKAAAHVAAHDPHTVTR
jgi:hypothetical protein